MRGVCVLLRADEIWAIDGRKRKRKTCGKKALLCDLAVLCTNIVIVLILWLEIFLSIGTRFVRVDLSNMRYLTMNDDRAMYRPNEEV